MFDPTDPIQFQKLTKTVFDAHTQLEKFRKERKTLVSQFVGAHYSDDDTNEQPVNLVALMQDIYLMHLAGSCPQVLLNTSQEELMPFAADLEAVLNQELKDMQFDITLRKWVQEALFSIGILKCGLVDSDYVEIIPGQPQASQEYFADVIDLDNFSFDTEASSWGRVTFMADRYCVDYDAVRNNEDFSEEARLAIVQSEMANRDHGDRVREISFANVPQEDSDKFKRKTWIWDIWLPEEGLIVTMDDSREAKGPLKVMEWHGPSRGPYHILGFTDVPGNAMPLAPVQVVRGLNSIVNNAYRKLADQGARNKRIGIVRDDGADDAEAIRTANDGDMIKVSNPESYQEVQIGGISQELLAFSIQCQNQFSQLAGNLDAMGGLGPQSDTFKQDQLIASQVSKKSAKMTRAVVDSTVGVMEDLLYYIYHDPLRVYETSRQIQGTDASIMVQLEPTNRQGKLENFNLSITPYSMQYQSPGERANSLLQMLMQIVLPLQPALQQQGISVNIQEIFETLSKYLDLPELKRILEFSGIPMDHGVSEKGRQSPSTHRTHERISRSAGMNQNANAQQMVQQLMSNSGAA